VLQRKRAVQAQRVATRLDLLGAGRRAQQPLDRIARGQVKQQECEGDDAEDDRARAQQTEQKPASHAENLASRVHLGVRPSAACLALLALACSSAARRGNTVILASGADLQSPNPLLTVHPLAKQVQRYALLVTLFRYDSTLTVIPYLARRWEWSADRTVLTARLFAGLRWHDGAPTTARDAAWTLQTALDPVTGYPRRSDLLSLQEASAPDDSTLVLRFATAQPGIPDVLTDL